MKITMGTVRGLLRKHLGIDAYIVTFVKEVVADETVETASINAKGVFKYNPNWTKKHVQTPEDLFCLVFHELLHPVFGHLLCQTGSQYENVAMDIIINATIFWMFNAQSGEGSLFRRFYDDSPELCGLLRPDSKKIAQSKFCRIYGRMYSVDSPQPPMTHIEILRALELLLGSEKETGQEMPDLIGNHGESKGNGADSVNGSNTEQKIGNEEVSRIGQDLEKLVKNNANRIVSQGCSRAAGYINLLIQLVKSSQTLRQNLLRRFATETTLGKFAAPGRQRRITTSPVPISPSKRDLVILAGGGTPYYFHNRIDASSETKKNGIVVYLDTSGSVQNYLEKILSAISKLRDVITEIHGFHTELYKISLAQIASENIQMGGTDFSAWANHLVRGKYPRAVVITDGQGRMQSSLKDTLIKQKTKLLVIKYGYWIDSEGLSEFCEMIDLDACLS